MQIRRPGSGPLSQTVSGGGGGEGQQPLSRRESWCMLTVKNLCLRTRPFQPHIPFVFIAQKCGIKEGTMPLFSEAIYPLSEQ